MTALRWRAGSLADYAALAEFHYLRGRPAAATRVLVIEDAAPTVAERFRGEPDPPRVVAVLVESLPALSCRLRDVALAGRYAGWSDRRAAARLLNREVRCLSRVVVHPQWRGLGLAVALVREALATMTTPYTEALAAMGRVHPFFRKAGMREYRRWPLPRDQRLRDALAQVGVEPWELASRRRMAARLGLRRDGDDAIAAGRTPVETLSVDRRDLLLRELGRWAGRRRPLEAQLARARDHLLCEPVYYLKARSEP